MTDAEHRCCTDPLFVCLGDYIDRGPYSAEVLAFLRQFSAEHRVVTLVGNHDAMMMQTIVGGDDGRDWAANGMAPTAVSYGYGALVEHPMCADEKRLRIVEALRSDRQVIEDAVWLAARPLVHEDEHRIFIYAGLRPGVALADQRLPRRGRFLVERSGVKGELIYASVDGHGRRSTGTNSTSCSGGHILPSPGRIS